MKKQLLHADAELQQHAIVAELEVKRRSDRLMDYFLISYFVGGLLLSFYYDTWLIAVGVGGLSLIAYYSAKKIAPDSDLYQYILSVVLAVFMAQYIYQMHGMFEMHFTAFIGSAVLITYQNWKLQIPIAIAVVGHHAAFGYLQNGGFNGIYFTQLESFELNTFIIHIILAAVIFFICGLWSYQLDKYRTIRVLQAAKVERLQKDALDAANIKKEELERQVAALLDKAVAQGKHEIASDILHDIGNAVVGFGSYLTRIRRMQENDSPEHLVKLSAFVQSQRTALAGAIGETRADAMATMLGGIAQTQKNNQEEIGRTITEQLTIITRIQDILNIQRQYISGQDKGRKQVNLRDIINDSMSMLFASVDKHGVAVSCELPDGLPSVRGDKTRLMQVVLNILKNSIESVASNNGEKNIGLRAYRESDYLTVEVSDNGYGFAADMGGRLFEQGFTTKAGSAGMGLHHCRTIMDSHDGLVGLTSEGPGLGAMATVRFKI